MKATKLIACLALAAGACSGSDGDEGEDTSSVAQAGSAAYVGFQDSTVAGGTQGFFIFLPHGSVPENTVFPNPAFNFSTNRVKAQVVNINCNASGPTEGSVVATLNTNVYTEKYQASRAINSIGTGLVTGNCYRVKPTLDGFALGFTDFQVTSGTPPAPFHRVTPNSNLLVKWRLEASLNNDTDGDTVPDWRDNCPNNANTNQDPSACAPPPDTDGDGFPDNADNCPTVSNADQANQDGDSAGDACEDCDTDANKTTAGVCGCNVAEDVGNTDGDAVVNCLDACPANSFKSSSAGNCGCDEIDADTNEDGVINGNDSCGVCAGPT